MSEATTTPPQTWWLYVLRTGQGRLYTGISTNVDRRLAEHLAGRGARALRGAGDLTVAYQCRIGDRGLALQLEYRLKQRSRAAKEQLLATAPDCAGLQEWLAH